MLLMSEISRTDTYISYCTVETIMYVLQYLDRVIDVSLFKMSYRV